MLEVEATGKNLEQAIANALFELKAPREDVDIKILDEGGFFRKAKVRVSISPDEVEKYQNREKKREEIEKLDDTALENNKEEISSEEDIVEEKIVQTTSTKDLEEEVSTETVEKVEEKVEKPKKLKKEDTRSELERAKQFLEGLLNKLSLTAKIEFKEENDAIYAEIKDYSDMIGYRGEGLNALQYLCTVYVSKNDRHAKPIRLDCEGYRKRRESSLIALAHRMARKVQRTHSSVKLEPMTPQERRIIHMALADNEEIETFSKGEEPHRYLIIRERKEQSE